MERQQLKIVNDSMSADKLNSSSDGVLRTEDGREFKIHKKFLASRCPFFKDLFCGDFKDASDVILKGINGETLNIVLVYLYTGYIHLSEENAIGVIIASAYLHLDHLLQESKSFLLRKMTPLNCVRLFLKAWRIERLGIFNDFYRFIMIHFEEVVSFNEEIGCLPLKALKRILRDKSLNLSGERTVWNAIVRWVNFDFPDRLQFVPELLTRISFEDTDEQLVYDIIHNLVRENLLRTNLELIEQHSAQLQRVRDILDSQSVMKGSRIPTNVNFIVQFCIEEVGCSNNLYITYDGKTDYWRKVDAVTFFPDCLIQLDRLVYMFDTSKDTATSFVFDLLDEICFPMTPISETHYHSSVVSVNGFIYAMVGVYDDLDAIRHIERYNTSTKKWEKVFTMVPMFLSELVAINGYIFAIGHTRGQSNPIMMVQVYDPGSNRWTSVSAPKLFSPKITAVAFRVYLYLIGGETAEEYDPSKDVWTPMPNLPVSYLLPTAVVLEDVLIVYEDYLMARRYGGNTPPVYWESEKREWHIIEESSPLRMINMYKFCTITEPSILREIVKRNRNQSNEWVKSTLG